MSKSQSRKDRERRERKAQREQYKLEHSPPDLQKEYDKRLGKALETMSIATAEYDPSNPWAGVPDDTLEELLRIQKKAGHPADIDPDLVKNLPPKMLDELHQAFERYFLSKEVEKNTKLLTEMGELASRWNKVTRADQENLQSAEWELYETSLKGSLAKKAKNFDPKEFFGDIPDVPDPTQEELEEKELERQTRNYESDLPRSYSRSDVFYNLYPKLKKLEKEKTWPIPDLNRDLVLSALRLLAESIISKPYYPDAKLIKDTMGLMGFITSRDFETVPRDEHIFVPHSKNPLALCLLNSTNSDVAGENKSRLQRNGRSILQASLNLLEKTVSKGWWYSYLPDGCKGREHEEGTIKIYNTRYPETICTFTYDRARIVEEMSSERGITSPVTRELTRVLTQYTKDLIPYTSLLLYSEELGFEIKRYNNNLHFTHPAESIPDHRVPFGSIKDLTPQVEMKIREAELTASALMKVREKLAATGFTIKDGHSDNKPAWHLAHHLLAMLPPIKLCKSQSPSGREVKKPPFFIIPDQEAYIGELEQITDALNKGLAENIPTKYRKQQDLTEDAIRKSMARQHDPLIGAYSYLKPPKNFSPINYSGLISADEPIYTLALDTDAAIKACVSRSGGRTWFDLVNFVTLLPNFRLVLTETDGDFEKRGAIFYPDKNELKPIPHVYHRKAEYRHYLEPMQELLSQAHRVRVEEAGRLVDILSGDHPHVTIYRCPFDEEFLNRIIQKQGEYARLNSVQAVLGELHNPLDRSNIGEKNLYRLLTEVHHPGQAYIASDDRDFLRKTNKNSRTISQHPINFLTFRGLIDGIIEGVGAPTLRQAFNKIFGAYEVNISPEAVLARVQTELDDTAGKPEDTKEYTGTYTNGKPAVSFHQAVSRGVELFHQLQPNLTARAVK